MVLADGMGGHAASEVASRLAISSLVNLGRDTVTVIVAAYTPPEPSVPAATDRLSA